MDLKQSMWLENYLTPHPIKTYLSELRLDGAVGNGRSAAYVICNDPLYRGLAVAHKRARQTGWPLHELATGHDAMVINPAKTTELLETIAAV